MRCSGKTMQRPVLLMRPGAANKRLAAKFTDASLAVWAWPAFRIELPANTEQIEAALAEVALFDMVVIPSPAAVAAVSHWVREWPSRMVVATVGEGTARAVRAAWPDVEVLSPEGDARTSGSEALWELVEERGVPARVLFLRGQTGREWLPEHFARGGADVKIVCAYVRVPIELDSEQVHALREAVSGPAPVLYITSSDAVDALMRAFKVVPGAREWLTRGAAVTIHPRVEARLREAGFANIRLTGANEDEVYRSLLEAAVSLP